MPGSGNFTSVTLGPDDTGKRKLIVNGTSTKPDLVEAVYIAVARLGTEGARIGAGRPADPPQRLRSTSVAAPDGAGGWTAFLNQARPAYKVGEKLVLVGVIVNSDDGSASFWHQVREIEPG
jgi:hypothetical protein